MKDFSPHAILRHPSISDEEVERLIKMAQEHFSTKGPVILILEPDPSDDPFSPIPRDGRSSPAPWRVSEKLAAPMSPAEKPQGDTETRPAPGPRKTKTKTQK